MEQFSQVRKLCIVTHLRSESQLEQLERLKADQQRIEIEYQFSASLPEWSSRWAASMLWCATVVWTCTPTCAEECTGPDRCREPHFEVHGDFNAADRAPNAPVPTPVTLLVHHPHRRNTARARRVRCVRGWSLSRTPNFECSDSDVGVAPRKNEVKQQQD